MTSQLIKDNEVMYQKKYPRGCQFKRLQLRTSLRDTPFIYRIEFINGAGEVMNMVFRKTQNESIRLYNDIATLSADEVMVAFGSMA